MAKPLGPSASGTYNTTNPLTVSNQGIPASSQAIPLQFNFAASPSYQVDFTSSQWAGKISNVQSAFVDNSAGTTALSISSNFSYQSIEVPAAAQAYIPIVCPNPPILTFACPGGGTETLIILLNVPMPACVWFPSTSSPLVTSGVMSVSDAGTASSLAGVAMAVSGPPTTLQSRSVTTPATPASTNLMPTATWRKYVLIKAPETADLWINIIGGTASIGGADCFKIAAGTTYESASYVWQSPIYFYCATGSLQISAVEG